MADIKVPSMCVLEYVFDAMKEASNALTFSGQKKVPLIGFAGSPFTLACYMVEGKSKTNFLEIRRLLYMDPTLLHHILDINAQAVALYLNGQINSGADAVMLFDTWGGLLNKHFFEEFSLNYIKKVVDILRQGSEKNRVPVIIFTKDCGRYLKESLGVGADAFSLDSNADPIDARLLSKGRVALQGNLDPAILLANTEVIRSHVSLTLKAFSLKPGYIFNLGHGVLPETPVENVDFLIKEVHRLSIDAKKGGAE